MTAAAGSSRTAVRSGSAPLIVGGAKPDLNHSPSIRLRGLVWQANCRTAEPKLRQDERESI